MHRYVKIGIAAAIPVVLLLFYWIFFLNHVAINEIGVAYNSLDGKITVQESPGWYKTTPFIKVVTLPTCPLTVEIPSGAVVINKKIVRFKPEGVHEFIRLQGFSYTLDDSLGNILMGYAYSGQKYPFLEILQEAQGK